mgnify:CR=1 FL=1
MHLLDLYCCAGGMSAGYARAGFQPFGIDIDPQPNYPYPFLQMDALEALSVLLSGGSLIFAWHGETWELWLADFAAIHASPPCQSFLSLGAVNKALGRTYDYPNLIGPTRELLLEAGLPYVIENVEPARPHLIDPVRICGTGLNQPIRRHRLFESNLPLEGIKCRHDRYTEPRYWTSWRPNGEHRLSTVVQVYGNGGNAHEWPAAMNIDWMTNHEMAEAVPPSYGRHIGKQLVEQIWQPVVSSTERKES